MSSIPSIQGTSIVPEINSQISSPKSSNIRSFSERMKEVLGDINDVQLEAGKVAEQFANGEIEDIHDVIIAAEKAGVGLELVLEVRNKLVDAYREISRMQM